MSGEVWIRIPGEPCAQGRTKFRIWRAGDGRQGVAAYDPAKSRNWKAAAQEHMRTTLARYELTSPLVPDGPVELAVFAYFTCPKTDWRKRDSRPRRWHTKKPDGDNILKAIKDAAKGVLWLDDSQVARATVEKIIAAQGEAPSVQVRVRRLEPLAALREEGACPS